MFVNVFDELLDFMMAKVLERVESLGGKHLGGADASAVAPPVVTGSPSQGVLNVGLGGDGFENRAVGEGLIVLLEDFLGGGGGGGDNHRDRAQAERDERAIGFG